jgi:hypothetical protein
MKKGNSRQEIERDRSWEETGNISYIDMYITEITLKEKEDITNGINGFNVSYI